MEGSDGFIRAIKPFKFISVLYGVWVFDYNRENSKIQIKFAKWYSIIGLLVDLGLFGPLIITYFRDVTASPTETLVLQYIGVIHCISVPATHFFYTLKARPLVKILQKILDEVIELKDHSIPHYAYRITIFQLLFSIVSPFVHAGLYLMNSVEGVDWIHFASAVFSMYYIQTLTLISLFFSNVSLMGSTLFRKVNSDMSMFITLGDDCGEERRIRKKIGIKSAVREMDLRNFEVRYDTVSDMYSKLKNCYKVPLTVFSANVFILNLAFIYFIFVAKTHLIYPVVAVVYLILSQWYVIYSCEAVINEVRGNTYNTIPRKL